MSAELRIGYVNNDEVNQALASRLAEEHGAVVCGLHPDGPMPDGMYDAVLYNLDEAPRLRRGDVLAEILRSPSECPKAVHGYDLSEDEVIWLRLHGVAAAQRLQQDLVQVLFRAILLNQASVPPDDALGEETWVSLAD
jgi:hypothetical protein